MQSVTRPVSGHVITLAVLPGTSRLAPGGTREEARQAMENIRTTLEAHGPSIHDVVKCAVMP